MEIKTVELEAHTWSRPTSAGKWEKVTRPVAWAVIEECDGDRDVTALYRSKEAAMQHIDTARPGLRRLGIKVSAQMLILQEARDE